nr:RNA-directed DNA polymerase, eukaryota, reverse transcriptase zinc-binding domain protein [Tanacetum cinerariifolium]
MDNDHGTDKDRTTRINRMQELKYLEKMELIDLVHKSRAKYEVEGDENLKFFYGLVEYRRKSHMVQGIMLDGVWNTKPKDIKSAFLDFYKDKIVVGSPDMHLSYLFYADDVIILFEWNLIAMELIIRILNIFYIVFGLKINIHKSNVYEVGVLSNEVEIMASYMGCEAGFFPFTYFGLPIGLNISRVTNWQPLIDRFKARLSSWKANLLSIGGRLTLIKYVLSSKDSKKLAWVKWSNIIASFDKGGLGVHVVKAIHGDEAAIDIRGCHTNGVWTSIFGTMFHLHSSSIVLLNSICFNVGDGSSVRF